MACHSGGKPISCQLAGALEGTSPVGPQQYWIRVSPHNLQVPSSRYTGAIAPVGILDHAGIIGGAACGAILPKKITSTAQYLNCSENAISECSMQPLLFEIGRGIELWFTSIENTENYRRNRANKKSPTITRVKYHNDDRRRHPYYILNVVTRLMPAFEDREITYAAVAANISCRRAFVNTLIAALNRSVKSMMRTILRVPWPGTRNNAVVGTIRSTTAMTVSVSRTITSMRYLLYK